MSVIDASIRRPISVFMITTGFMLFGLVAATRLSVDLLPDISYPSLTIRTDLPDAAPADVEQFVTREVEEGVGVVPGLVRMYSISRPGQSEVVLEFNSGTRMDLASLSVREKLDLVELPREAKRPAILRFDPSLDPIIRMRLSGGGNLKRLRRIAERTIKRDLEGVEGVAAVRISGGEEEEIQVEVDEGRLAAVGLTLADVTERLGQENINLAGGSITEGRAEYLVRATNQFESPEEIGEVILAVREGGVIRVSDVAEVGRGAKDREVIARVGGEESVELAIFKEGDANTVGVAQGVKRRIDRLDLPGEMELVTVADQSRFIEKSVSDVVSAALLGGFLAILVLFAFLRNLRTTLIIAVAIPVSILVTAIAMYRFGLSLNLMSLGGLALAVGMVVDSGIVVLESIFRKQEEGEDPVDAASSGARTVAKAVTASTLTTVAVFLPLVFVEGLAGQLIKDQALTISISLLAALVVSVTLVPTIYAFGTRKRYSNKQDAINAAERPIKPPTRTLGKVWHFLFRWGLFLVLFIPRLLTRIGRWTARKIGPVVDRLLIPFDRSYDAIAYQYPRLLKWSLAHRGRVLAFSGGSLVVTIAIALLMPSNLFPTFSQGEFYFNVRMPEGTALHVTDSVLDEIASIVKDDPRVKFVYTSSGQTNLSEFAGSVKEPNRGQIAVVMRSASDRKGEAEVVDKLRGAMSQLPGVTYEFDRPSLLSFKAPVEIEIFTYDLDTLRTVSEAVVAQIASIKGIEDVEASIRLGDPEVQITFDRERLAAMDLDPSQASRLIRNAVQGEAATQFDDLERKLDVRVRANADQRSVIANLEQLQVGRNKDMPVRLGSVADITIRRGPSEIRRISQQRAALVTANIKGRDLSSISNEIRTNLRTMDLPPGTRVALAGQNRELTDSFSSLRFAILLAIFLVYLVMASQFESLVHPFVVMFSLPLALVGVILTLLVTGTTLSVMVLIGLVVLAGIVVNNAIVLVDFTNQLRKKGMAKTDALIEAGRVRLRPILMTTATTILGLLPLAIGLGEGVELRAPLALTLIGGLAFATLLTLIVIPVVYSTVDRSA